MKIIAVALAVTFFTASGATAAFIVTSANIKNGTIQPIDLSAKTKRVLRGSRGPAGPRGAQGFQGLQGPPGPPGTVGSLSQVQSVRVQVNPGAEATAQADCPTPNGRLTGGGFYTSDPQLAAYISEPWGQGWKVTAFNFGANSANIYAFAMCAIVG